MRVVVSLQIRSRNSVSDRTFHTFFNHSCFVFPPCKQINLLCAKDSGYTHCNRTDRRIIQRSENLGCFVAWCIIQQNQTSGRIQSGTRFVERDVTYTANAQQGNINTSEAFDALFVQTAIFEDGIFGNASVGSEYILLVDVDMIQQHILQSVEIAVDCIRSQWIIFVHIKYDHITEAESFFLVHTNKFRIYVSGRISSRKSQYAETSRFLFFADGLCYFASNVVSPFFYRLINVCRYFLESCQDWFFKCILRSVVSGGDPVESDLRTKICFHKVVN